MIKPIDIIYDAQQSFESTGFVRAEEYDAVIMHGLDSTSISATCGVYSYRSTSDTEGHCWLAAQVKLSFLYSQHEGFCDETFYGQQI